MKLQQQNSEKDNIFHKKSDSLNQRNSLENYQFTPGIFQQFFHNL